MDSQELQRLKNKYDIRGNDAALNRALETAVAVAPTDLTVLITGESGVGKENIPKIIHQNSRRRNGKYFAVNCGAIPEGTIDSELFGHEKGSFTGAIETRRGYFQEADGGRQAYSLTTAPANIGEAGTNYGFVTAYANGLKFDGSQYMAPEVSASLMLPRTARTLAGRTATLLL